VHARRDADAGERGDTDDEGQRFHGRDPSVRRDGATAGCAMRAGTRTPGAPAGRPPGGGGRLRRRRHPGGVWTRAGATGFSGRPVDGHRTAFQSRNVRNRVRVHGPIMLSISCRRKSGCTCSVLVQTMGVSGKSTGVRGYPHAAVMACLPVRRERQDSAA
jgi:hypothetical protein